MLFFALVSVKKKKKKESSREKTPNIQTPTQTTSISEVKHWITFCVLESTNG